MRLRCLLFVPGDRPDQMTKALQTQSDALILDLEDSVAPRRKSQARLDVAAFLRQSVVDVARRSVPCFVRLNPLQSGLTDQDLEAIAAARPDGVLLPKAEGAAAILDLTRRLDAWGLAATRILPIATETPNAVFRLGEYAGVASRLVALTWGAEDLSTAVGAASPREADGSFTAPYEMVRALTLFAAHAAAVPAIDTVYPAFRDHAGLSHHASRGARDGFSGMLAIHPAQVPHILAAYTPSTAMIEHARRVVAEFRKHPEAGVVSIDGSMLDAPHLKHAQRVLAQVEPRDAAD